MQITATDGTSFELRWSTQIYKSALFLYPSHPALVVYAGYPSVSIFLMRSAWVGRFFFRIARASSGVRASLIHRKSMADTNSSGSKSANRRHKGLSAHLARKSHKAFTAAPTAMWMTPVLETKKLLHSATLIHSILTNPLTIDWLYNSSIHSYVAVVTYAVRTTVPFSGPTHRSCPSLHSSRQNLPISPKISWSFFPTINRRRDLTAVTIISVPRPEDHKKAKDVTSHVRQCHSTVQYEAMYTYQEKAPKNQTNLGWMLSRGLHVHQVHRSWWPHMQQSNLGLDALHLIHVTRVKWEIGYPAQKPRCTRFFLGCQKDEKKTYR